eukprot:584062-Prymnesium_polylepis.1
MGSLSVEKLLLRALRARSVGRLRTLRRELGDESLEIETSGVVPILRILPDLSIAVQQRDGRMVQLGSAAPPCAPGERPPADGLPNVRILRRRAELQKASLAAGALPKPTP